MIQISSGILGAVAATLAFGAVHLEVAAGNDLFGPRGLVPAQTQDTAVRASEPNPSGINRSAKGDRADAPAFAGAQSMTLSFGLADVPATSIVMRLPVKDALSRANPRSDSVPVKSVAPHGTRIVACEPPVSFLAPAARQLEPSRCVT